MKILKTNIIVLLICMNNQILGWNISLLILTQVLRFSQDYLVNTLVLKGYQKHQIAQRQINTIKLSCVVVSFRIDLKYWSTLLHRYRVLGRPRHPVLNPRSSFIYFTSHFKKFLGLANLFSNKQNPVLIQCYIFD